MIGVMPTTPLTLLARLRSPGQTDLRPPRPHTSYNPHRLTTGAPPVRLLPATRWRPRPGRPKRQGGQNPRGPAMRLLFIAPLLAAATAAAAHPPLGVECPP